MRKEIVKVHEKEEVDASKKKKKGKKGKKDIPSVAEFRRLAKAAVEFEQALADATPEGADGDPILEYNPTNLTVLSYNARSIEWTSYFSALTVRPPQTVILTEPDFIKHLDSLLSRTKDDVLGAYFFWTTLRTLGVNLGPHASLRRPADRLERRSKGVDEDAPEDRVTVCQASLNEALGYMSGRWFVKEAFSAEAKSKVEHIIGTIIEAFKARLPEVEWLDDKTRAYAQKKAEAIRIKVGYPDSYPNTEDAQTIYNFYADLDVSEKDYFGNVLRSKTRLQRRQFSYTDRKLNPGRWDMFPAEVNAYYSPPANEIVFPAGLLQPPYFSLAWPDYMQYGAFGQTAGHELSHAFDPAGRLYDKDGYLRDWWTRETTAEFNERKQCILDQYGNYTIDDGKGGKLGLNAKLSIGEDVADGGGIEQSFRAWKNSLEHGGREAKERNALLPGVPYTREQLFFIVSAKLVAMFHKNPDYDLTGLALTHSLPGIRHVVGPQHPPGRGDPAPAHRRALSDQVPRHRLGQQQRGLPPRVRLQGRQGPHGAQRQGALRDLVILCLFSRGESTQIWNCSCPAFSVYASQCDCNANYEYQHESMYACLPMLVDHTASLASYSPHRSPLISSVVHERLMRAISASASRIFASSWSICSRSLRSYSPSSILRTGEKEESLERKPGFLSSPGNDDDDEEEAGSAAAGNGAADAVGCGIVDSGCCCCRSDARTPLSGNSCLSPVGP